MSKCCADIDFKIFMEPEHQTYVQATDDINEYIPWLHCKEIKTNNYV